MFTKIKTKIVTSPAIEVLSTLQRRPTYGEAKSLSYDEVIQGSKDLNHPVDEETLAKITRVQDSMFCLVEGMMTQLLKENENELPTYFPLARDCELFYDALTGLSQARVNGLEDRLHLVKTSMGMRGRKVGPEYFNQLGITQERIDNGSSVIFLDSGFQGSLFQDIRTWAGIKSPVPNQNFKGYLAYRSSGDFNQLKTACRISRKHKKEMHNSLLDSPYDYQLHLRKTKEEYLLVFMQLSPKFTGRYVQTYQKPGGFWDVMPERNLARAFKKIKSNKECKEKHSSQINTLKKEEDLHVNSDIVHPGAALILQKRVLDYFTNPNVWDRVYSKAKIRN